MSLLSVPLLPVVSEMEVPVGAGESGVYVMQSVDTARSITLEANPLPVSALKLVQATLYEEVVTVRAPDSVADTPLAVSVPCVASTVGPVMSEAKDTVPIPVFPAESRPVTVYVAGLDGLAVHEKFEDAYVMGLLPEPDDTVSATWVQPVVLMSGNVADAGPAPPSVTAALRTVEDTMSPW